ncbi:hypothetical protein T492DRAFT_147788 [Pavlovales sp. CCMP2436]|nr:hypothetical protein T492DRAFT_147788 [Pavlovales sp. CCMP2436]
MMIIMIMMMIILIIRIVLRLIYLQLQLREQRPRKHAPQLGRAPRRDCERKHGHGGDGQLEWREAGAAEHEGAKVRELRLVRKPRARVGRSDRALEKGGSVMQQQRRVVGADAEDERDQHARGVEQEQRAQLGECAHVPLRFGRECDAQETHAARAFVLGRACLARLCACPPSRLPGDRLAQRQTGLRR